ncbi:unnamed protein product, partial [Mesorhabditis belari]|uniref:Uncharacterized protein n=1 Tax=Mesorhabditis belari TaxID=2138241 RepID=A0AAF3FDI2_9BILA
MGSRSYMEMKLFRNQTTESVHSFQTGSRFTYDSGQHYMETPEVAKVVESWLEGSRDNRSSTTHQDLEKELLAELESTKETFGGIFKFNFRSKEDLAQIPRKCAERSKTCLIGGVFTILVAIAVSLWLFLGRAPERIPPLLRAEPIKKLEPNEMATNLHLLDDELVVTFYDHRPGFFHTKSYDLELRLQNNLLNFIMPNHTIEIPCINQRLADTLSCCSVPTDGNICHQRSGARWSRLKFPLYQAKFLSRDGKIYLIGQNASDAEPFLVTHNGTIVSINTQRCGNGKTVQHFEVVEDGIAILYNHPATKDEPTLLWIDPFNQFDAHCVKRSEEFGTIKGLWMDSDFVWFYRCLKNRCLIDVRLSKNMRPIYEYHLTKKEYEKYFIWNNDEFLVGQSQKNALLLYSFTNNANDGFTTIWREIFYFNM